MIATGVSYPTNSSKLHVPTQADVLYPLQSAFWRRGKSHNDMHHLLRCLHSAAPVVELSQYERLDIRLNDIQSQVITLDNRFTAIVDRLLKLEQILSAIQSDKSG
jgi:hypothetical protein